MRAEYDFSGGVRGKYYKRYMESSNVVVLEPDVHKRFKNSSAVNKALRSLIRARKRLGDQPNAVVLRDPQAGTLRLLEITGLTEQFPVI